MLETTLSNHQISSSTLAQMTPPRVSSPLLRMLLRSSSLVTSPSPVSTISGLPTTAVRPASRLSSSPPLLTPRRTPVAPTLTSGVSQAALPGILPGSVPTHSIARTSSSTTSGRSAAVDSPVSLIPAPAQIVAATPMSVCIHFNREIVVQSSILKSLD